MLIEFEYKMSLYFTVQADLLYNKIDEFLDGTLCSRSKAVTTEQRQRTYLSQKDTVAPRGVFLYCL